MVFDMDGVVIDSHPVHKQAWRMFLESVGQDVSDDDLDFVLDGRKRDDILLHFFGSLDDQQLKLYGSSKDRCYEMVAGELRLIPGVREFLIEATGAGLRIGLATSASRTRVQDTLARFGLSEYFDAIATGSDVPYGKPDPAVYALAVTTLGIDPATAVVFEDAVSGIQAARSARMACIGIGPVSKSASLLSAGASMVIGDFRTLSVTDIRTYLMP